jgi:hypothetical protein
MERDPEERIDELLRTTTEYLEGWRGEKKKTARLRAALIQALTDNVWHAYFTGSVHDGSWWDAGMSDAEWLERELGLPMHVRHPVEDVTKKFPALVERLVKQAEAGQ